MRCVDGEDRPDSEDWAKVVEEVISTSVTPEKKAERLVDTWWYNYHGQTNDVEVILTEVIRWYELQRLAKEVRLFERTVRQLELKHGVRRSSLVEDGDRDDPGSLP